MKYIKTFLIITSFFFTTGIYSQFSVKLGTSVASLSAPDQSLFDIRSRPDFLFGVHYQFFFTEIIGIEPGLMYQNLTTRFSKNGVKFDAERDYIAIPVLIKVFPKSSFSFGGGLQAAFLANDNFDDNFDNRFFNVSGQLQVTFSPIKPLGIEAGYNYGFTPYVEFENKSFGGLTFTNGDGNNKFFYLAVLLNLR